MINCNNQSINMITLAKCTMNLKKLKIYEILDQFRSLSDLIHFLINFIILHYISIMFQNNFESDDPSTLNFSQKSNEQPSKFKLQCNAILTFIVLGFVFLIMAMIELITNYQEFYYTLPLNYDLINNKLISSTTYVTYIADDSVNLYLDFKKITQFSFTNKFDGESIELFDENANNCNAYRLNNETNKTLSISNSIMNPNSFSIPCGKYPSMFIGTKINLVTDNGTYLPLNFNGTSVFDYNARDIRQNSQWTSLQHPLFRNWMEQNAMINTLKFIGKVNGYFEGNVHLQIILSNGLPKDIGPIYVNLTNNKALGGKNSFFCLTNFIQSGIMFGFAFLVYFYQKIMRQQIKKSNNIGQRKIQLKANYESQAGKMRF